MANIPGPLNGKVVLVTGATNGIGKVTAQALAGMGATTLIVGRDAQRTAAVSETMQAETGNPEVIPLVADLASQGQIRRLAGQIRGLTNRLDVLVNNAGALFMQRAESADGIEMTFALNHLNYFMLTHLLLDLLRASPAARVVNVSSEGHRRARLDFNDLQNRQRYSGWKAYEQSKLANLYFTYGLAASLSGEQITVNALHPGLVASNFGKSSGRFFRWILSLTRWISISPAEGAQTVIYLAASPEVDGVTGKYFIKQTPVSSSHISRDMSAARKLWDASLELTGLPAKT